MVGEGVARVKGVAALIGQPSGQPPNSSREKGLGCVYPVQPDSLAVHLNGIAVDRRGDAGHVGQGRGGEQAQGEGEGAHGRMLQDRRTKLTATSASDAVMSG